MNISQFFKFSKGQRRRTREQEEGRGGRRGAGGGEAEEEEEVEGEEDRRKTEERVIRFVSDKHSRFSPTAGTLCLQNYFTTSVITVSHKISTVSKEMLILTTTAQ